MPTCDRRSVIAAAIAILGTGMLAGCVRSHAQSDPPSSQAAGPVAIEDDGGADIVSVAHPEQFPLATAAEREVHGEVQAPCVVAPDVARTVPVLSLAGGRVVEIRARLGDTVRKGQVLVTIQSPDVSQARADLRKYEADAELARRSRERAAALSEHEALAAKDLEAAVNADTKAQVDLRAARERLALLTGSSESAGPPVVELKAPVDGVIIEQNVTTSAGVKSLDNSPSLFTIADLSHVWIVCDVNENNLADVRLHDPAEVALNAYPDQPLNARVANMSRVLDTATRSVKVRLELPNPDAVLRPGMFASATFATQHARTVTVVPGTAVLRLHDRDWVFTPIDERRFRRTEVHVGRAHLGIQDIASGLRPGERVVLNALQFSGANPQ